MSEVMTVTDDVKLDDASGGGGPVAVSRRVPDDKRKRSIRPDDKRFSSEPLDVVIHFRVSRSDLDRIMEKFVSVSDLRDFVISIARGDGPDDKG